MLDKKIRNIDARVELLEDRMHRGEIWYLLVWILAVFMVFIGALIDNMTYFGGGILLALCGAMFYGLILYLEILIVLRKMKEGDK